MRLDSIKVRITSFSGITLLIVMVALIGVAGNTMWNSSIEDALVNAEAIALGYASKTQTELDKALVISRTMATSLGGMRESQYLDRVAIDAMLKNVLAANPRLLGSYTIWEPNKFDARDDNYADEEGYDESGQYIPFWTRDGSGGYKVKPLSDYGTEGYYLVPKSVQQEVIINPYRYEHDGIAEYITSLVCPIFVHEKFVGIAGIDINLTFLQVQANEEKIFDGAGELSVIAYNGEVVAFSGQPANVGRNISELYPELDGLNDQIKAGKVQILFNEKIGKYQIFEPIWVGKAKAPWGVMVTLPKSFITDKATSKVVDLVITALAFMLLGLAGMWIVASKIANPLIKMSKAANVVADSSFQKLDGIPEEKEFYGELLDLHRSFSSMVEQAVAALGNAETQSNEARDKARVAEQAVKESEQAKREGEQAMQRGIAQAASRIQDVVERVSSASEQLSVQVAHSSEGALIQRDRTTEAATAIEEMNATVLEVAKNASEAAANADASKSRAVEGATVVSEVVQSITEINNQIAEMKTGLDELGEQAEGIGQIMNVISDIADQTNLLALNAAIEAARAGEAGRGFAVVADEVRKLAEKTMAATSEVGQAISSIQSGTRNNITSMDRVAVVVENSTVQAQQSGSSLAAIVEFAESTADQVRAIATASEEQAATSEQIHRSTEEVSRVSTENNESMEQASEALAELSTLTGDLAAIVREMQQG
ncbi:methyl-accepting chemotaxis protein [Halodesulfovibrio spirochaetisodalis]|uniref:Methyl-accepting transducer domain-containing protein n=1 Tax=Halodesulfovibrio spirochaetisodalis TaxID=1560234 RepID=A0A1B7XAG4_9BACT|nr:methyl-accepting chemotaxis protein [Halodesulfovibrio spirochaetisodalis]OBQ46365.1 hypothetical protein SP90_13235 [Halodesulfovibrio spirochaetisodalis]